MMRAWENQYIQLVATKPELIVAEKDRESPAQSREVVAKVRERFDSLYVEIGSGSGLHL